jgi:hypothetical protein
MWVLLHHRDLSTFPKQVQIKVTQQRGVMIQHAMVTALFTVHGRRT